MVHIHQLHTYHTAYTPSSSFSNSLVRCHHWSPLKLLNVRSPANQWYITGIHCQLGDYIYIYICITDPTYLREAETAIELKISKRDTVVKQLQVSYLELDEIAAMWSHPANVGKCVQKSGTVEGFWIQWMIRWFYPMLLLWCCICWCTPYLVIYIADCRHPLYICVWYLIFEDRQCTCTIRILFYLATSTTTAVCCAWGWVVCQRTVCSARVLYCFGFNVQSWDCCCCELTKGYSLVARNLQQDPLNGPLNLSI